MPETRQIALAFPITIGPHANIVRGILSYAREHANWTFVGGPENVTLSVLQLKGWRGDGVIAEALTKKEDETARKLGLHVVSLSGSLPESDLPRVIVDHYQIGRLAAEELLRCEIRRFAYYGLKGVWYSQQRCQGFAERIAEEGYDCSILQVASTLEGKATWHGWLGELQQWLATLQPPFGLMGVNDHRARMAIEACRQVGWYVPHDVAVVGVDNDPIACEASSPTLTTVARNDEAIGYQAAQWLDRLISGNPPAERFIQIPPIGVVARESTDMVAVDDPKLSLAVQFIRQHQGESFNIEDVLRHAAVSRRWLEYRFRDRFGRSPHEYISESRVERAKLLLGRTPRLHLQEIAQACGFTDSRNLRLVFRRQTGMSPAEYRRTALS
jgi:LacI family transcriptional regulator